MFKRISLAARISLLSSALIAVVATSNIRVPHFVINSVLRQISPELAANAGNISLKISEGKLLFKSVVLSYEDKNISRVSQGQINIGVNPLDDSFLQPVLLRLDSAKVLMNQRLQILLENTEHNGGLLSGLQIDINKCSFSYRDHGEEIITLDNINADGTLNDSRGVLSLNASCTTPVTGEVLLELQSHDNNNKWDSWVSVGGEINKTWPLLNESVASFSRAALNTKFAISGDEHGITQYSIEGNVLSDSPRLTEPNLSFEQSQITFSGSSAQGLVVDAETLLFGKRILSHGRVDFSAARPFSLYLEHIAKDLLVDEQLQQWLGKIEPDIATYVDATQARGVVDAQIITNYDDNELQWAINIEPQDISVSYQGIPGEIDEHFSFPYPAELNSGFIAIARDSLLFNTAGRVGQGSFSLIGDVDFLPIESTVNLEIAVDDIKIDQRVPNALSGSPAIAKLWRDLGSPSGGHADALVRIYSAESDIEYLINIDVRDCQAQPAMLPLQVDINDAQVTLMPDYAKFTVKGAAAQSLLNINGSVNGLASDAAQLRVHVDGTGWHPSERESNVMSSYLPIPAGLASFPFGGEFSYRLNLVWPNINLSPHLSAQLFANNAKATWPELSIDFSNLSTHHAQLFATDDFYNFQLGAATADANQGSLVAKCNLSPIAQLSTATVDIQQLPITNTLVISSQKFAEQSVWGDHLDWNGAVSGFATFDPLRPQQFDSVIEMNPLVINSKSLPNEAFELSGKLNLSPAQISAEKLILKSPHSALIVHQLAGDFIDDALLATAVVESNDGVQLNSSLPALAGSEFALALEQLQLEGELFADSLKISSRLSRDGSITADFEGGMTIEKLDMKNGIPLSKGFASIDVKNAWWNSADDFGAAMTFSNGSGYLSDIKITDASAAVQINARELSCQQLQANLLEGDVRGSASIGFTGTTPINIDVKLSSIDLGEMRNELGITGALSGTVNGNLRLASPSPSPTFSKGIVDLTIKDGVLGSVPVLKSIWDVAGLPSPIIDEGNLNLMLDGSGKINVNKFNLYGTAFDFTGDGTAYMDSTINLKVTMRTLGPITRIPLLKDLLDLFIEQQIYGPIDSPVLVHRTWAKWFGNKDFLRPPFPLWVPAPATPDWNISPVIPVQ
ncbi:MAG: hypothetical protein H8E25_04625 [Planctomycetes bacterium]|nr:hypothetical protein [Planctomycetota bacterium]